LPRIPLRFIQATIHPGYMEEFHLLINKQSNETFLAWNNEPLLDMHELKIKGQHNALNALAVLAIAYQAGLPMAPLIPVLKSFKGLPHRCAWIREYQGVTWYNDSKGTNIGATVAAIAGLGAAIKGKVVLLAGGLGKGADFTELQPVVKKYAKHIILFGQDGALIGDALKGIVSTSFAQGLDEAVQQAVKIAEPNDIVLLSPACASWDMFNNFEHRGQVFCELVQGL
ncbi:MAG: hypothetical protein K2Q14_01720, partial [Gammaproteobacteria bacterium]|nr:hypothetical protein [Gammaproteobacteria bacterium]